MTVTGSCRNLYRLIAKKTLFSHIGNQLRCRLQIGRIDRGKMRDRKERDGQGEQRDHRTHEVRELEVG